jgi:hypothetical protein
MATATSIITTEVDHVSVMACADDIKVLNHGDGRRAIKVAGLYVYLDSDGVTTLLERLLLEPEAAERTELLPELSRVAEIQQSRQVDMIRQAI